MNILRKLLDYEITFLKIGVVIFAGAGVAHWSNGQIEEVGKDVVAFAIVSALLIFNIIVNKLDIKRQKKKQP
jgi:hypothetical protein